MYFARRISQAKPLQRLEEDERYARFRLGELEELSGIPRANASRAFARLSERGFLGNIEVAKGDRRKTIGLGSEAKHERS